MKKHIIHISCIAFCYFYFMIVVSGCSSDKSADKFVVTHGPILGRLSHNGIGVWVRTSHPIKFNVICKSALSGEENSAVGKTFLEHDNTGWAYIAGLKPNSRYTYEIEIPDSGYRIHGGEFLTLPHEDMFKNPEHNPRGLFNFSFEHGCGNLQGYTENHPALTLPGFKTMLENLKGKIHFQIMNGDWLYEEVRDTPLQKWQKDNNVPESNIPRVVQIAPTIVGVWENYKLYLSRGKNLATWHRYIPTFFTFDDHEILNDIYGTGSPGFVNKRAVFRDIGVQAWYDYIGWSNPPLDTNPQGILFGKAKVTAGSGILLDSHANFSNLDLEKASNLHIHWGTSDAGVSTPFGPLDTTGGHPAAGVYKIEGILDQHRLKIYPAPKADGDNVSYSIGRVNYYRFRVCNCDFFILDTRGNRGIHDIKNPRKKGLSMIGEPQKKWLIDGMLQSDADFFFVVSSVNFSIPHGYYKGEDLKRFPNKDEAWTVFLEEREQLIDIWEKIGKPVFVLTGDLHNSIVVKITDNIWEFASGPHNSDNHPNNIEGYRPPSGDFEWEGRTVNIRWSTYNLNDVPHDDRWHPYYSVVQVNNVFNNPQKKGEQRWVAFPQPQVVFQYYSGLTGELLYAEAITASGK